MGDAVDLFYAALDDSAASQDLVTAITEQAAYLKENLGVAVQHSSRKPHGAVMIATERQDIALSGDVSVEFTALLAVPAATVCLEALVELTGSADAAAAVQIYLASRDLKAVREEAASGVWSITVDGQALTLTVGKHLFLNVADM